MGGGVITPPYNGWYETYEFKFYDLLIKADNLNFGLSRRDSLIVNCQLLIVNYKHQFAFARMTAPGGSCYFFLANFAGF